MNGGRDPVPLSQDLLSAARAGGDVAPLVERLAEADPAALSGDAARLAFWLNVYNARVKTAVRERGLTGSLLRHRGFFREVGWVVGGRDVSLHVMEHGIVRVNRRAPYTPWRPLAATDPRAAWAPSALDPRVHFALNCGALSCPPIRAYTAEGLDRELELATRSYLDGEVVVGEGITLPYLFKLYRADFGARLLEFVAAHVDEERAAWIRAHPRARIRWGPYRWEIAE